MSKITTTSPGFPDNEDDSIIEDKLTQSQAAKQQEAATKLYKTHQRVQIETPEDLQDWKQIPSVHIEKIRTENSTRKWISYAITFVFVVWSLGGGVYLTFFNGNIQVLIAGSAFISGPLGIVIGYYFGIGDERKK